ncbi:hypothetical protein [Nostoc sp. UIC 10630]|uniref:hypothetical protein n=1 Tax=Nostoc sp. UIC 10630 TaxID=2100146 RepID=UPI0013D1FF62|nr:hypothetical protein [Nostoc sp. UIC 10630]NEU79528.1 hypothetical protein [Nostoc sp. UIC 10630]
MKKEVLIINTNLEEFSYLWDSPESDWALLKFYASSSEKEPRYLIVNMQTKRGLLVHDDTLYQLIKETMLEKKVRIVLSL